MNPNELGRQTTSYPGNQNRKTTPIHDSLEIRLLLATEPMLIDLLATCQNPIYFRSRDKFSFNTGNNARPESSYWESILSVSAECEVPIKRGARQRADCILTITTKDRNPTASYSRNGYSTDGFDTVKVLVEIKSEIQSFGDVLGQINTYRSALGIKKAILICQTVTDMEMAGFQRANVSVYPGTGSGLNSEPRLALS